MIVPVYNVEQYLIRCLESLRRQTFEGYEAIGCYDHYPTEKEMNILWANRITEDELNGILDETGIN